MGLTSPSNQPMTPQAVKDFEVIINLFESKLSEAGSISNELYEKMRLFREFSLDIDNEKDEVKSGIPDGIVSILNLVLDKLDFINRRNKEILKQINTLI